MANRPISIEFIADVASYLRDVKKMEISTEDVADALVAVSNSGDDLERKLGRAMKDAESDVDRLKRAIDDIPKATGDAATKGRADFDRLGQSAHDSTSDFADAGKEAGGEFRQNLGESLSSGGGISDILTDTVGGLVGSLGGAGALVATAVGASVLSVFNGITKQIEAFNQDVTDQVSSMWSNALGSVGEGIGKVAIQLNEAKVVQEEISRLWEDDSEEMEGLVDAAKRLHLSVSDVVLARAGDKDAIDRVNAALETTIANTDTYAGSTDGVLSSVNLIHQGIDKGSTSMDLLTAKTDAYNASLPAVQQSVDLITQKIAQWSEEVRITQDEVAILTQGLKAMPDEIRIKLSVNSYALQQFFPYGTVGGGSAAYQDYLRRHPEANS